MMRPAMAASSRLAARSTRSWRHGRPPPLEPRQLKTYGAVAENIVAPARCQAVSRTPKLPELLDLGVVLLSEPPRRAGELHAPQLGALRLVWFDPVAARQSVRPVPPPARRCALLTRRAARRSLAQGLAASFINREFTCFRARWCKQTRPVGAPSSAVRAARGSRRPSISAATTSKAPNVALVLSDMNRTTPKRDVNLSSPPPVVCCLALAHQLHFTMSSAGHRRAISRKAATANNS